MLNKKPTPPWLQGYPLIGYDPQGAHCCFQFLPNSIYMQISDEETTEEERIISLFPKSQDIEILFTPQQHQLAEKFTGIGGRIFCTNSEEGNDRALVINHQSAPFATTL